MRKLRVWFCKTGRAKYVSHLDLNRCMLRALRRAEIPVWYTEGFNPHPYMTFALPLPLGVESVNDVMDIRIDGEMEDGEVMDRLNRVLPGGLEVTGACEPWCKVNEIAYARYEFYFDAAAFLPERLRAILDAEEIPCERMGKERGRKVVKQFNLAEYIKEYDVCGNVLSIVLAAGSVKNVNPVLLSDALERLGGGALVPQNIRRTALLTHTGQDFS